VVVVDPDFDDVVVVEVVDLPGLVVVVDPDFAGLVVVDVEELEFDVDDEELELVPEACWSCWSTVCSEVMSVP